MLFYRSGNYHELSARTNVQQVLISIRRDSRARYDIIPRLIWYSIPLLDILLKNAVLDSFPPSVVYFITLCDA